MNKFLQTTLLVLLSFSIAIAQWTQTPGPEGGKIVGIEVLANGDYFAVTEWGGVYKSTDDAENWTLSGTTLVGIEARGSANIGTTILIATPSGIYRSADSGTTWALSNTGLGSTDVWVVKAWGANFIVGTANGVFSSTDGQSWADPTTGTAIPTGAVYDLSIDPENSIRLLAATAVGLYQSINDGLDWAEIFVTGLSLGDKFTKVTYGNKIATGPTRTKNFATENEDAGGSSTGVYYTKNDGVDWNLLTGSGFIFYNLLRTTAGWTGIGAGTSDGMKVITTSETSWITKATPFYNQNVTVWNDQIGSSITLLGTGGGIYRGLDYNNLVEKNKGMQAFNITALLSTDDHLFTGTALGGIFVSEDLGLTWDPANSGISGVGYGVLSFLADGTDIYVGTSHGPYKSTDNGANWSKLSGGASGTPVLQLVSDGTTIYMNETTQILKSADGGTTWTDAMGIGLIGDPKMLYSDWPYLYVGGDFVELVKKAVYRSVDGGIWWWPMASGIPNNSGSNYAFAFYQSGNNLLAATSEGFYKSTDAANTWEAAGTGLPAEPVVAFTENADGLFATTDGGGVYFSDDNGDSFSKHNNNTGLTNLYIGPIVSGSLYVGTKGSSIWQEGVVYKQDQVLTSTIPNVIVFDTLDHTLDVISDSGLPVTLSIKSGPGTLTGDQYTLETVGVVIITATQAGDDDFIPVESEFTFTVTKGSQSITFIPTGGSDIEYSTDTITMVVSSSSRLPVTVEKTGGGGAIFLFGKQFVTTGVGNIALKATQFGDDNWNAAAEVQVSFDINKANQTITFEQIQDATKGDVFINLVATASSGLTVIFASNGGKTSISGSAATIDLLAVSGLETITAIQPGNELYNPAQDKVWTFCISPSPPLIELVQQGTAQAMMSSDNTVDSHEWFIDDVSMGSGDLSTYSLNQAGTYKAIAEGGNACPSSGFSNEVVVIVTGLTDGFEKTGIAYPNPFHDRVTLRFAPDVPDEIILKVVSVEGRIKKVVNIHNTKKEYNLDVSDLQNGVYIIQLTGADFVHQFKIKKD